MLRQRPSIAMEIYPSVQKITEVCFSVLPIAPSPQRTLLRDPIHLRFFTTGFLAGLEYPVDPRILAWKSPMVVGPPTVEMEWRIAEDSVASGASLNRSMISPRNRF
jgi:hypothetical protein